MATRLYLVELRKKKVLVEAASQEAAIKRATAPTVKRVTIPTPLEALRYQREGVEVLSGPAPATGSETETQSPAPEGQQAEAQGEGDVQGGAGEAEGED